MELWPHQIKGVADTLAAINSGQLSLCLTSPTGCGKTRIMWEIIKHFQEINKRTVLYTNRKLLVEQTSRVLHQAGIRHGVRSSGYLDQRERAVQISSVQTEAARSLKGNKWDLHRAELVLIDEAHIQKGKTVRELIKRHKNAAVIGFTATPLGIGEIYENLIVAGKTSDGRKCGALVPCVHYGCDEPDMRNIKVAEGKELTEKQQVSAMRRPGLFGRIWDNFCKINPDKRPTVCFGPDVEGSIWIAEQFTKKGVRAAHVDGECVWVDGQLYANSKGILQDIIGESKDGGITVLTNRFVLREGVDLPWLSHGIFACVFGQTGTYLQAGGRLLRSYPKLDHVTIQDHGGNYWRHSSLNLDREWDISMSESAYQATNRERLANLPLERQPFLCPRCGRTWTSGITCREEYGGCGFDLTGSKRSRPVVTERGDLVELPGSFYQPKKEFKGRDGQYKWKQMYWRARSDRWNATFRQAEAMFAYENFGMWPDRKWPLMPKRYLDLWRKVKDVKQEDLYQ